MYVVTGLNAMASTSQPCSMVSTQLFLYTYIHTYIHLDLDAKMKSSVFGSHVEASIIAPPMS